MDILLIVLIFVALNHAHLVTNAYFWLCLPVKCWFPSWQVTANRVRRNLNLAHFDHSWIFLVVCKIVMYRVGRGSDLYYTLYAECFTLYPAEALLDTSPALF